MLGARKQSRPTLILKQPFQAVLQHVIRLEVFNLKVVRRSSFQSLARNQSDQLAAGDPHAVFLGFQSNLLENLVHRSLLKRSQIHGDLGLIPGFQFNAQSLDVRQTSAGFADGFGNGACNPDVRCVQIDVVGDQQIPCADCGGACAGMELAVPKSGRRLEPDASSCSQSLKLAAPDVFQADPIRVLGCSFVKIDWDLKSQPGLFPHIVRNSDAVL